MQRMTRHSSDKVVPAYFALLWKIHGVLGLSLRQHSNVSITIVVY